MPMDFILLDLISPFEITLRRNQYGLAVICIFTNYVMHVLLLEKPANTVVYAYLKEKYCRFEGELKPSI